MASALNVNSVGGAPQTDQSEHIAAKGQHVNSTHYTRTFQHYMTNNNASTTPLFEQTGGFDTYSQGWAHIDYTRLASSMTVADRDTLRISAAKYRVKEQGFRIKKCNLIQQTVVTNTLTTNITNSFVQVPTIMVFKDTHHDLYEATYDVDTVMATTSDPIWAQTTKKSNTDMTMPFAPTFTNGELIYTKISLPNTAPTNDQTSNFDILWGGDISLLGTGEQYGYTWNNDKKVWFTPNMLATTAAPGTRNEFVDTMSLIDNTVQMYNEASTNLPDEDVSPPLMHLLRVPPLRDTLGPISIGVELWIEYFCIIEWIPGRYVQTLNVGSAAPATLIGTRRYYPVNKRTLRVSNSSLDTLASRQRRNNAGRPYSRTRTNDTEAIEE